MEWGLYIRRQGSKISRNCGADPSSQICFFPSLAQFWLQSPALRWVTHISGNEFLLPLPPFFCAFPVPTPVPSDAQTKMAAIAHIPAGYFPWWGPDTGCSPGTSHSLPWRPEAARPAVGPLGGCSTISASSRQAEALQRQIRLVGPPTRSRTMLATDQEGLWANINNTFTCGAQGFLRTGAVQGEVWYELWWRGGEQGLGNLCAVSPFVSN